MHGLRLDPVVEGKNVTKDLTELVGKIKIQNLLKIKGV